MYLWTVLLLISAEVWYVECQKRRVCVDKKSTLVFCDYESRLITSCMVTMLQVVL